MPPATQQYTSGQIVSYYLQFGQRVQRTPATYKRAMPAGQHEIEYTWSGKRYTRRVSSAEIGSF